MIPLDDTIGATWSPEHRLLQISARDFIRNGDAKKSTATVPRAVGGEINEDVLLQVGEQEGMLPIVREYVLKNGAAPDLSGSLKDRLHAASLNQHMNSLSTVGNLLEVLDLFEHAHIEAVPFKGPVLSQALFGDVGYRRSVDLDLLLPREAIRHAKEVLVARGFIPQYDMKPQEEREYIDSGLAYGFYHTGKACLIELHWTLMPLHNASTIPPELVWDHTGEEVLFGRTMLQIDHRLLLVYLCLHASKHQWSKMKWIIDIASLLHRCTDEDLREIVVLAGQLGCRRVLNMGILLSEALFSVTVTPSVQAAAHKDRVAKRLVAEVLSYWLFMPDDDKGFAELAWYHVRERERVRDKLPLLLHDVGLALKPSEKDKAFVRLPDGMAFLYPLVRPARLVSDLIRR